MVSKPRPLPPPIAAAFARQAKSCHDLGSPFTATLCSLIASRGVPDGAVRDRIAEWPTERADSRVDALPLRLCGALHYLVLTNSDPDLTSVYPPANTTEDRLFDTLATAIVRHETLVDRFLDSPPQTNETARSAVLLPGFLHLTTHHSMPLVLSELGSSAGLNQNWHRFRYDYGSWSWGDAASPLAIRCDWEGPPPECLGKVDVTASRGCDIAPFPIDRDADRLKLRSYVWPDQPARHQRLDGALRIAADHMPKVDRANAGEWLENRLAERHEGRLHVIFHTIMWQYMPVDEQSRIERLIGQAGERASPDAPLAWLRFETDSEPEGAPLHVTTWSGSRDDGRSRLLARADFHGRWIKLAASGTSE